MSFTSATTVLRLDIVAEHQHVAFNLGCAVEEMRGDIVRGGDKANVGAKMLARFQRRATRSWQLHRHHLGRHQRHGGIDDDGVADMRGDLLARRS